MKRHSFAVFFLISVLMLLAIPQLSAQVFPSEFGRLRDSGCASQPPFLQSALRDTGQQSKFAVDRSREVLSTSLEFSSKTGFNVPGFMGFYNACAPSIAVHVYHGDEAQEELALYQVPIDDFAASLFAERSWDPVNAFEPDEEQLIKRIHVDGSASEDTVPFWYGAETDPLGADGLLKQTAIPVSDGAGEMLSPGVYFMQFSTSGFEHSYASSQSTYRTKYFLNVATAALTLKRSGGQLLVWAVDVNSGAALAGERVDIYGANATLLASGETDESGVLKLDFATQNRQLLAVLKTKQHFALGYTGWDTNILPEVHYYFDDSPPYQVHVYTDRQVYLPGQSVHFQGIVRVKDDMNYTLPDFKTVKVVLRDKYRDAVREQEVQLSDFGSFHGVFASGGLWSYGPYDIQVSRGADDKGDGPYHLGGAEQSFIVAKYQKLWSGVKSTEVVMETHASITSDDLGHSVDDQRIEIIEPVRLIEEKTEFRIGERARILVTSPFEGEARALVTIERDDVISHELITLPGKTLTYEFEILPEHVPNIYVRVFILKAVSAGGRHPIAAYQMGLTELGVNPERQRLNIDISKARQSLTPAGKETYAFRVTDYKGDPVAAEISVALVDPAAQSPLPRVNAPLLSTFYGRQQLYVATSSSLVTSAEGEPGALSFSGCCGAGCGGQIYFEDPIINDSPVETPYWNPTLRTDAHGEATIELNVPESLPGWRLDVRAITDSADGSLLVGEKTFDLPVDLMA